MIKIIENFIPEQFQNEIENILCGNNFPWYYNNETTNPSDYGAYIDLKTRDTPHFVHGYYGNNNVVSDYFSLVKPLLYFMPNHGFTPIEIYRCKSNLTLPSNKPLDSYVVPHVDILDTNYKTLLYYVNDSDGDTIFFKETPNEFNGTLTINKSSSPKRGTAVIFDSNIIHSKRSPVKSNQRVIINFIVKIL